MFENLRRGKKFYNKCSENSRCQIVFRTDIFRKLSLGAPETTGPRTKPIKESGNLHYDWFIYPSASVPDPDNLVFTIRGVRRKWKRPDSPDSYSVALMTPIFDSSLGHKRSCESAYDPTPTPSLVKTSPLNYFWYPATDLEQEKFKIEASLSVFTHVASGCVNLFRQKKAYT